MDYAYLVEELLKKPKQAACDRSRKRNLQFNYIKRLNELVNMDTNRRPTFLGQTLSTYV